MATIKANGLGKYLENKTKAAQKATLAKWKKAATPVVKREMQSRIGKGQSVVEGEDNFQDYSKSYKKAISGHLGRKYAKKLELRTFSDAERSAQDAPPCGHRPLSFCWAQLLCLIGMPIQETAH